MQAALHGAAEIGFTVVSITISLIAVFIPILLMSGIIGRLFREFAITLSVSIALSLAISLTMTPMMCSRLLRDPAAAKHGFFYRLSGGAVERMRAGYERSLGWVLRRQPLTLAVTLITIALTVYLYITIPKGFFPQQDIGRLAVRLQGDQSSSFQAMRDRVVQAVKIVMNDPAVETLSALVASTPGGSGMTNGAMNVTLKTLSQRGLSADQVIARLRPKTAGIAGLAVSFQSVQDVRIGARVAGAQYQYALQSESVKDLNAWAPVMFNKLRTRPELADVMSDQQDKGLEAGLVIDRLTAARMGISPESIDNTLYDAFGQRQVGVIYKPQNQYHW